MGSLETVRLMEDASRAEVEADVPSSERPAPAVPGRTRTAAIYEVTAYVLSISLRLGSNLILTRLLMPEAFGLMAMLNTVSFVLWMLSEVGLSEAVGTSRAIRCPDALGHGPPEPRRRVVA